MSAREILPEGRAQRLDPLNRALDRKARGWPGQVLPRPGRGARRRRARGAACRHVRGRRSDLLHRSEGTFTALADVLGFLFLLIGVWWMIRTFLEHSVNPLWWLGLISGVLMTVMAFWTAGQLLFEKAYIPPRVRRRLGRDGGHHEHYARVRGATSAPGAVDGRRGCATARRPSARVLNGDPGALVCGHATVEEAYHSWTTAPAAQRAFAFARYCAALDREEERVDRDAAHVAGGPRSSSCKLCDACSPGAEGSLVHHVRRSHSGRGRR
jgi:hypothetical protein